MEAQKITLSGEEMVLKCGILGDHDTGRSSFITRVVDNQFEYKSRHHYYNNSPGSILFMEKHLNLDEMGNLRMQFVTTTTQRCYDHSIDLVCSNANVIIFTFSLTDKRSLLSVKNWYKKAKERNKTFIPILVGTKFDVIKDRLNNPFKKKKRHINTQQYWNMTRQARRYAMKMSASLIYVSSKENLNISHTMRYIVAKVFNLKFKDDSHIKSLKLKERHWNLLKPLREHNIKLFLKTWGDSDKISHLVSGFINNQYSHVIHSHFNNNTNVIPSCLQVIIREYCQYDLQVKVKDKKGKSNKKKKKKKEKNN